MAQRDTRKTVLITGAGVGGIGGELAKEFHAKGYRVFAAVRRLETVKELEEKYGIESVYLDVTIPSSVVEAKDAVAAKTGGKLDVLVNNAGQGVARPCTDLEIETTVKNIFEVNLFGVMRVVQTFAPLLINTDDSMIVNIGSIAPIVPLVFESAYNASKAALHAYGDCLRMEMKPFGVHVLTIITGAVRSGIVRTQGQPLPENSLYKPIQDYFFKGVEVSQQSPMETAVYARNVVNQVVRKTKKPWFWYGYSALTAWSLHAFLWHGFTDGIMSKRFGLVKLAAMVKEQKKLKAKQA